MRACVGRSLSGERANPCALLRAHLSTGAPHCALCCTQCFARYTQSFAGYTHWLAGRTQSFARGTQSSARVAPAGSPGRSLLAPQHPRRAAQISPLARPAVTLKRRLHSSENGRASVWAPRQAMCQAARPKASKVGRRVTMSGGWPTSSCFSAHQWAKLYRHQWSLEHEHLGVAR